MLFNSLEYGLFFAAVLGLYYLFPIRMRAFLLFGASVLFYMSWRADYILLILGTLSVCYICIWQMKRHENWRQLWLFLCVLFSLAPLIYFKYSAFIVSCLPAFANRLFYYNITKMQISFILPLGISFYTFQALSYAIDVYRKKAKLESYPLFLLYVLFFPQLVAGPIVRSQILMPQLKSGSYEADSAQFDEGILLILFGLFKKVVIADYLATIIDPYFVGANSVPQNGWDCLLLLYAFSFQIYFDFAGYTDIARGCAKMLGIDLPVNFNFPYVATNLRDFWRRWHITLSTWLRDYLYISMGGARKGTIRLYLNLFITMLLGGLWHGASWTFVFWGAFHGILLMITRFIQESRLFSRSDSKVKKYAFLINVIPLILTYNMVCLGWLFFRAPDLSYAQVYAMRIFHFGAGYFESGLPRFFGVLVVSLFVSQWLIYHVKDRIRMPVYRPTRAVVFAILIIIITVFSQKGMSFIYFQF